MANIQISQPAQTVEITKPGEYVIELLKPSAEVKVHGVFKASGQEKIDVTVIIHHKAPHTRAETVLKGVADDKASINFTGRIIIDPKCGDTHSFLTERVLLLSPQAKATAVPDLEILSDDVSCSHAASISTLPESQVFYLQTRGLSLQQAQDLLVEGFLE